MLKGIVVLLAAGMLAACVSNPQRFDRAQIDAMMTAKPACGEVLAALGRPAAYVQAGRNGETVFYTDEVISSGPERIVPVIGPLVGGVEARTDLLVFSCDSNGRVAEYQYGEVKRVVEARYSAPVAP